MKRCPNCQKECNDQSRFCPHCGGALDTGETKKKNSPQNKKLSDTKGNKKLIGISAVVVVVAAIIVLSISVMGGRSCEQLIKEMETGHREADSDIIIGLLPDEMIDENLEKTGMSLVEYKEGLAENARIAEGYFLSYTLEKQTKYNEDELFDLRRSLKENFGVDPDTVKDGAVLDVRFLVKGEDFEKSEVWAVEVVKIGKDWYSADLMMLGFSN